MRPILKIIASCDGRVILSEEEFEEIINKTYEQGVEDGRRAAGFDNPYINQPYIGCATLPIKCDVTATPSKAPEDVIVDAVVQTLGDENEDD